MTKVRDPLQPAETLVHIVAALVAALTVLTLVATIFGSGSLFGIGDRTVCVEATSGAVRVPQADGDVVAGAGDDITSSTRTAALCTDSPSAGQQILHILALLPSFLVLIGTLALAVRLFRTMRRNGIFARHTAVRLRTLGWFVLAGEVAATLTESTAQVWLIDTMVDTSVSWSAVLFNEGDLSLLALFLGVVLISFSRIMRVSTAMREELAGTV
ncbi:DUF2975 domain-containing protein [Actinokineospora sp.]|uniref:DUF2975 domain-containing protein n=1 Tax=Actinokineospora sp. TaxID=1872133 RepID=UPI004037F294